MEARKRKNSCTDTSSSKKFRTIEQDFCTLDHRLFLELRKVRKNVFKLDKEKTILETKNKELAQSNEELKEIINKMEKRMKRIEKFNQDLREKNLNLEEELQNQKESEICDKFSSSISIHNPYSYIS